MEITANPIIFKGKTTIQTASVDVADHERTEAELTDEHYGVDIAASFLKGIAKVDERLIILLDLAAVLTEEEQAIMQAVPAMA